MKPFSKSLAVMTLALTLPASGAFAAGLLDAQTNTIVEQSSGSQISGAAQTAANTTPFMAPVPLQDDMVTELKSAGTVRVVAPQGAGIIPQQMEPAAGDMQGNDMQVSQSADMQMQTQSAPTLMAAPQQNQMAMPRQQQSQPQQQPQTLQPQQQTQDQQAQQQPPVVKTFRYNLDTGVSLNEKGQVGNTQFQSGSVDTPSASAAAEMQPAANATSMPAQAGAAFKPRISVTRDPKTGETVNGYLIAQ